MLFKYFILVFIRTLSKFIYYTNLALPNYTFPLDNLFPRAKMYNSKIYDFKPFN